MYKYNYILYIYKIRIHTVYIYKYIYMILILSSNIATGTRKKSRSQPIANPTAKHVDILIKRPPENNIYGVEPNLSTCSKKKCRTYFNLNGFDTGIYRGPMVYTLHVAACVLCWWLVAAIGPQKCNNKPMGSANKHQGLPHACVKRWGAGSFNFNRLSSFLLADVGPGPSYVFPYCFSTRKLMVVWNMFEWVPHDMGPLVVNRSLWIFPRLSRAKS